MNPEALRRKPGGLYERRKMKMEREHMEVLDFEAVRAIAAQTPDSELIRWVDEALREKSGYTLPPKSTSPSRTATITMSCPAFMSGATSPW